MKKIITSILFFVSITTYSQVNSPWTQYFQIPYIQNPALSGIEKYTDLKLGFKRQWSSFDGSPKDYFLGINHVFGKDDAMLADSTSGDAGTELPKTKMGLSGYVASSDYNNMSNLQGGAAYAVHIPLSSRYYLSFGIAAAYNHSKADVNDLVVRDKQDVTYINLINAGGALNYFNLDAGAVIYSDRLYAGYAAIRLVRTRMGSDLSGDEESSIRHTFLAGYRHKLGDNWEVQPAMLLRIEKGVENFYNFNVRMRYKSVLWTGVGFTPDQSVSIFAGYQLKNNLTLSYNYDFIIGKLNTISPGSHEIILGIMPFNKAGKKAFFW